MDTLLTEHGTAEAFAMRIVGILNDATLALMISIGHRTGLFDTMAELPPATSEQIADAAGLTRALRPRVARRHGHRRHCRHTTPRRANYPLPAEQAACSDPRCRAGQPGHAHAVRRPARQGRGPGVACFRDGGGVPYSAYPKFHGSWPRRAARSTTRRSSTAIAPACSRADRTARRRDRCPRRRLRPEVTPST